MAYSIDVLREAAQAYCWAESDYRTLCVRFKAAKADGTYYGDRSARSALDREYDMRYRESGAAWEKLRDMCRLVDADMETVLRVEKSIRRNSQYAHNWEREAHLGPSWVWMGEDCGGAGSEASYRRAVKA